MDIRLKTFDTYTGPLDKDNLAKNGFMFTKDKTIECFVCGCTRSNWSHGDDPEKIHQQLSPNCKFRLALSCNPSDVRQSNANNRMIQYSLFASFSSRLESFRTRPCNQSPEELASAGFVHIGPQDQTLCYACGGVLARWQITSNPWTEHIKHFPECYHLSLTFGDESLKSVQQPTSYNVRICKICFEKPMSCCMFPCGHVIACADCAQSVKTCCICTKDVTSTRRVYYA
jgi:baculoviral IAP repeat-containing protein 7/8